MDEAVDDGPGHGEGREEVARHVGDGGERVLEDEAGGQVSGAAGEEGGGKGDGDGAAEGAAEEEDLGLVDFGPGLDPRPGGLGVALEALLVDGALRVAGLAVAAVVDGEDVAPRLRVQ